MTFEIGEEETQALKSIVLEEEITLFMLLLAVFNVFLSKLSGQEDIIVGTPIAGRRHADLHQVIGMFVNSLPLRNFILPDQPFTEFLKTIKKRTLQSYENQEYSFEDLVDKVIVERDAGRNPLFDVVFALQNIEFDEKEIPGLTLKPYKYENHISKFDLTLTVIESTSVLSFSVEYCSKLFKEETISRFITFFKNLVAAVITHPEQKISGLSILPDEERQRLLYEFNDTRTGYPREKTIPALFMEQVAQRTDRIALVGVGYGHVGPSGEEQLSYGELNRRSDQLAELLREKGVAPDLIVGMIMERSADMLTGILGILKAGGAYLPLDPDFPEERKHYMLCDTNARVLLSTGDLAEQGQIPVNWPGEVICLNDQTFNASTSTTYDAAAACSSDLVYVIYTSGTTGIPKGTLTTHANVIRVVRDTNYIGLTPGDRLLQLSNYSFDGSVFDIYGALLNGAALVLIKKEDVLSIDRLSRRIIKEAVTVFFVTTALFNTLVDLSIESFTHIRNVQFGGEQVSVVHVKKALEYTGSGHITHVYGPTEATVYASYYFIDRLDENAVTIPIGKPLANTLIYILDKQLQPVPIGVNGEMYIGGEGVARGYLNQPELTAEKFVSRSPHQRLYRTGDLARWLPEGNVEFIGRIDQQVKIRGFRIEPGEIETRLLAHPAVKEAFVLPRIREGKSGDKYLCAYIVPGTEQEAEAAVLRDFLSRQLPDYMVPAHFVFLERLPLTANGKVNRKELPEPEFSVAEGYRAPRTPLEKKLAEIFSEVLGIAGEIGIDDDFFEAGGHSLKATIMTAKIHKDIPSSHHRRIGEND